MRSIRRYSRKKCPKGSISRRKYSYKKKSLKNKKIKVRASCVKSRGRRSRGLRVRRVLPSLRKGSLTKYGYHLSDPDEKRHKALKKAFTVYGYSSLIKKLNAVRIYNKSKPTIYNKYTKDMLYVRTLV